MGNDLILKLVHLIIFKKRGINLDNKVINIDLSNKKISYDTIDKATIHKFLGGRGISRWILLNELKKGTKAFDADNKIIIAPGLLTGTNAPGACRVQIDTMSPFNNGVASGNGGGFWGASFKKAGWSYIVIEGKSETPVYIFIENEKVRILDASNLWGKTTWETQNIIQNLHGEDSCVLSIGPAGENKVYSAAVIIDKYRTAARCGLGAVMGSKKLKCIGVLGTGKVTPQKSDEFNKIAKEMEEKILNTDVGKGLNKAGTSLWLAFTNDLSWNPVRNYQDSYIDSNKIKNIYPENWKNIESKKIKTCYGCPVDCGFLRTITDGPYKGTKTASTEANAFWDFSTKLDIYDPAVVHKAQEICNRYGLDIDSVAGVIAWAYECYEKGILKKSDTDNLELEWGNDRALIELLKMIALKKGIGEILSYGCYKASQIIGKNSIDYCLHVKKQDLKEPVRTLKGWALGVMVSPRAGTHTRGCPETEVMGMSEEVGEKLFGVSQAGNQLSYEGKAKLVVYFEKEMSLCDSLGLCSLISEWNGPDLPGIKDYAKLCSAFLGEEISYEKLLNIGERITTLEKYFNQIHTSFDRKDDYPPERLMEEGVKTGPLQGEKLDKEKWSKMLDEYYELHKWDKKTGKIPVKRLKELDIYLK